MQGCIALYVVKRMITLRIDVMHSQKKSKNILVEQSAGNVDYPAIQRDHEVEIVQLIGL